ncbi:MAG: ferrous iron transporter B [Clostridia bacterium]|nr:ferrous iron transporter B [Clostridia bacterium]
MKNFALAGNPNCGKTTLFNALTGSTAHVGNWPGVTVDKKEGVYKKLEENVNVVDLPGIYSLSPYTPEEVVARNYILDEKPDCVINIIDATNLERNLYLTTQIMEIDVPMVIALNMMDAVEKAGDKIDAKDLEARLGLPVIPISALRSEGIHELMERAYESAKTPRAGVTVLEESAIKHLVWDVKIALSAQKVENPVFHAVKLVEEDELEVEAHKDILHMVDEFKSTFDDEIFGTDFESLIADGRYKYITKNFSPALKRKNKNPLRMTTSDKVDRVLTHKIWGIPIFLAILFAMFHLTFSENFLGIGTLFSLPTLDEIGVGEGIGRDLLACVYDGVIYSPGVILFNLMDLLTATLSGWISGGVMSLGASDWVMGFVSDGVLAGISGVLSFVPQIVFLLLLLSILEDTGYMARVAFILDRICRKFGVSGRAFIPMIMGFGCSVPAMINTRTLADEKEKVMTIRAIPFFTCGAKVPVLTGVAGAIAMFFNTGNADIITYSMYVLGLVVAVVTIIAMHSTTQRGEITPFIMELPAYHLPSGRALMIHLWDKVKHYVKKVFTIILASTIVIWFLSNFSWAFWNGLVAIEDSILASLGKLLQPIFTPLGFGSQLGGLGWMFVVAAITGLIAKENVIATFAALSAVLGSVVASESGVTEIALIIAKTGITIPGLLAFIVFNMTTIPCFASVATAKGELGRRVWWTILFWMVTSMCSGAVVYAFATMFTEWSTWSILVSVLFVIVAVLSVVLVRRYNKLHPKKR